MSVLTPFHFMTLMHPWALALLAGVPILLVAEVFARAPGVITVSTGETLARATDGCGPRFRWGPPLLRALGLAFLIIALARPLKGYQPRKERVNVVDIMLCVDVSGSMRAMDFEYAGQRKDRLYVTKEAVRDFLESRKAGREDRYGQDRIGLILYAKYAWTQCPLTLDYGVLEHELGLTRIDEDNPKHQATAIGSAIGLAVSRLRKSESKSKVIVLLTDGRHNAGELDPMTAARLAKDFGIRIYTIGAGSGEKALVPRNSAFFGRTLVQKSAPVDEAMLMQMAAASGGKFYRATDMASLEGAYAEINQLETTEIELADYYEHEEAFVPYAILGTLALGLSVFVRRAWFETIP